MIGEQYNQVHVAEAPTYKVYLRDDIFARRP